MASHCELIKKSLQSGDKLTGLDILNRFNCMNYKGRISDIRNKYGYSAINTEMIKIKSGKKIALYSWTGQLNMNINS